MRRIIVKKVLTALLILVLTGIFVLNVSAAENSTSSDWEVIGSSTKKNNNKTTFSAVYVYMPSVISYSKLGNKYVEYWTKINKSVMDYNNLTMDEYIIKELDVMNCTKRLRAISEYIEYDRNGNITYFSGKTPDYSLKWEGIVPESLGETEYKLLCR